MTVEDNLRTGSFAASTDRAVDVEEMYELFPVLREKRRELGGNLSGGQQQMLAIARGLMARPRLLMLDEPSLGLAPIIVSQVRRALDEITKRFDVGIVLVEQNTSLALPIANRGYVLSRGRVIAHGEAEDLRPTIEAAYLGQRT
jgi:branched-chain amino acid transport system ATP-binding protein